MGFLHSMSAEREYDAWSVTDGKNRDIPGFGGDGR